ncbi:MAG: hypothetical protein HGA90_03460, partial [Alphaproteobacteria bacterium]|nr:hypothetical protein [Alphaproteobacteria bacterium]
MDNTSQTDNVLSKFTPAALELLRHANGGLVNLNLFCRIEPDSDWGRSWDGIKFDFMLKKAPIYREYDH